MNKKIKFVYFDVGGVFLRWRKAIHELLEDFNDEQKEVIFTHWKASEFALSTGRKSVSELVVDFVNKDLNIDKDFPLLEELVKKYTVIAESHDFAKTISLKYPTGLLTNLYKDQFNLLIKHEKIPNLKFDAVVDSSEVGLMKPGQKIYKLATELSGYLPEEIYFIDDNKNNVEAAKNYGWDAYRFDFINPSKSINEISKIL